MWESSARWCPASAVLALLALACGPAEDSKPAQDSPATEQASDTGEESCQQGEAPDGSVSDLASCTDGVCEVPAGEFWMGASDIEDACPARWVELSAYAIDQHEVTRGEWHECAKTGTCVPVREVCTSEVEDQDHELQPITCVSWQEAADYCAFVGGRLPTEAEWEKAARGPTGAEWAWGAQPPSCLVANYRFAASYCWHGVVEVGTYPDSVTAYGLLDTVGNSWEWVTDWYEEEAYTRLPAADPLLDEDCEVQATGDCTFRVIRGGAFNTTVENTRSASRSFALPEVTDDNIGFRCAYNRGSD